MMPASCPDNGGGIPRHRREQITVLSRMFGEPEPLPSHRSDVATQPSFTPLPGRIATTPTGAFSWTPAPSPDWVLPASAEATQLCVYIDHRLLDHHCRARKPEAIAKLKTDIEAYGGRIGVYSLPLDTPPRAWTITTIRRLIDVVLPLIPNDDRSQTDADTEIDVALSSYQRNSKYRSRICIKRSADCGFYGQIVVEKSATPAIRHWMERFGSVEFCRTTLRDIDAALSSPIAHAPRGDADSDPGDDDDLDAIEKAARRALHGDKAIPRTSAQSQRTASARGDGENQARLTLLNAATDLSGPLLLSVASFIRAILDVRGAR